MPGQRRHLFAGCGFGAQTVILAAHSPGASITSIDISEASVAEARKAVAAAGGTESHLNRAALAISQMSGKGVIQMEELRQQLGEAIPRATELIIELGRESIEEIAAALAKLPPRLVVRLALPTITRAWDRENLAAQIRHFFDAGHRRWEAANLSALEFIPRDDDLDLSADWPLYTLNSAALAELRERGLSRFTVSPEDTVDNIASLATRHPFALVWPVHRDPPLFISESCPHAARLGKCPGPKQCDFTEQSFTSRTGEAIQIVNRNCRFHTLLNSPAVCPPPPGLPLIPRADFLIRAWSPDAFRHVLSQL